MRAEAWASWAAWATALVAGIAAYLALRQVFESKRTREKANEPHVAAYLDLNSTNWNWFDLVIKNFGPTTAYNVKIILPPLKVVPYVTGSGVEVTEVHIPDSISMLVPGQEWRTVWDCAIDREERKEELQLPTVYAGRIEYDEAAAPKALRHERNVILDTEMFRNSLRFGDENPQIPLVAAIEKIASTLSQYQHQSTGIWVYPEHPDEQRAYLQVQRAYRRERPKTTRDQADGPRGRTRIKVPHRITPEGILGGHEEEEEEEEEE